MAAPMDRLDTLTTQASIGAGGGVAAYGAWTAQEIAAYGGLAIAVITLALNVVFKVLHYRLAKAQVEQGDP